MYIIVFIYKKQPHHLFSYIKLDFYTWPQNHLFRGFLQLTKWAVRPTTPMTTMQVGARTTAGRLRSPVFGS